MGRAIDHGSGLQLELTELVGQLGACQCPGSLHAVEGRLARVNGRSRAECTGDSALDLPHNFCISSVDEISTSRANNDASGRSAPGWKSISRKKARTQQGPRCLRVATWNALSLDRESEDTVCRGLAVPAGITWIAERCVTERLDLVGIQETRIQSLQDHFKLQCGYTVVTQAAGKNKGGLMLLIRENKHLSFEAVSFVDERVMLVHIKLHGVEVSVVVAHAPVRDAPTEDHEHFCSCFRRALTKSTTLSRTMVLADLNMRVQGLTSRFNAVGPLALSRCRLHCEHGIPFLELCDHKGLHLANTFVCDPADFTWTHPKGHRIQIDYVLLSAGFMSQLISTFTISAASMASVVQSDHDMVVVELVLEQSSKQDGKLERRKAIRTAEQKAEFQRMLSALQTTHAGWLANPEVPPEEKLNFLDAAANDILAQLPKPRDHPKKPWIQQVTWECMKRLGRLREAAAMHRLYGDLDQVQCAVSEFPDPSVFWRGAEVLGVGSMCTFHIKQQARAVRRMLIKDKRSWFHEACGRLDDPALDKASLHDEFKRLSRKVRRRQVRLLHNGEGQSATTISESNEIWAAHWQQQLCALRDTTSSDRTRSFPDVTTANLGDDPHATADRPGQPDTPEISAKEVELSFRKISSKKAASDPVHPTAYCLMKGVLIPVLQQLYNKCLQRMEVPHSWKEAQSVPVPKKCAPSYSPTGFRPIVLSHNETKIFERVVRGRIEACVKDDVMQFGAGKAVGCDLITFIHQQVSSELVRQRRPHGILFVDVRGAFDSMVRQLVWATDKVSAQQVIEQLGLKPEVATIITQAISNTPALLLQDGIPLTLVKVIESLYDGDWLVLGPHSGNCSLKPMKGTRQGGSLSGLLWCRYQCCINQRIHNTVTSLGLTLKTRLPASRTLAPAENDTVIGVPPTVFMDDVSCIVVAPSDRALLRGMAKLTPVVHQDYQLMGLDLNYKPNKTCVMFHFTSKERRNLQQMFLQMGEERGLLGAWFVDASQRPIPLALSYELLGKWVADNGNLDQEISARVAKTHEASRSYAAVLKSGALSRRSRITLTKQYVLVHLTQGAAVLPIVGPTLHRS
eukprot:6458611-Amphidinium_carterae.2